MNVTNVTNVSDAWQGRANVPCTHDRCICSACPIEQLGDIDRQRLVIRPDENLLTGDYVKVGGTHDRMLSFIHSFIFHFGFARVKMLVCFLYTLRVQQIPFYTNKHVKWTASGH